MTWKIVINNIDCDWLFIDIPENATLGRIEKLCSHPESESRFCAENTCPKKLESTSREYRKYEFCEDIDCIGMRHGKCSVKGPNECICTAKDFHHWLNENGFKIVKAAKEGK